MRAPPPHFPCFLVISTVPSFSRARITQSEKLSQPSSSEWPSLETHRGLPEVTLPLVLLISCLQQSGLNCGLPALSAALRLLSFSSLLTLFLVFSLPVVTLTKKKKKKENNFCELAALVYVLCLPSGHATASRGPSQRIILKSPSPLWSHSRFSQCIRAAGFCSSSSRRIMTLSAQKYGFELCHHKQQRLALLFFLLLLFIFFKRALFWYHFSEINWLNGGA